MQRKFVYPVDSFTGQNWAKHRCTHYKPDVISNNIALLHYPQVPFLRSNWSGLYCSFRLFHTLCIYRGRSKTSRKFMMSCRQFGTKSTRSALELIFVVTNCCCFTSWARLKTDAAFRVMNSDALTRIQFNKFKGVEDLRSLLITIDYITINTWLMFSTILKWDNVRKYVVHTCIWPNHLLSDGQAKG